MRCHRCRGLLVCETFDDLIIATHSLCSATRCINCGYIEDAVIRENRFRRVEVTRVIPRGRVSKGDLEFIKIHSEGYASIS